MRIARYIAHGSEHFGVVDGDNVTAIEGSIFDDEITLTDHVHTLSDVKLLAPVMPGKILAMGLNYTSHVGDRPAPPYPMVFHKTPTSVIGPEDAIIRPRRYSDSTPRVKWSSSSRIAARTSPRRMR